MRLVRIPQPFDHRDMLWELKYDGFRALADVRRNGTCTLTSRNGFPFQKWNVLAERIARDVLAGSVMLDGEIVCLDADGRSNFYDLLFRRAEPCFLAFDVLAIDGENLTALPLVDRKRHLRGMMPRRESRLHYVDAIRGRSCELFALACDHDLEGIVGKWAHGTYQTTLGVTSWVKVKNPTYLADRRSPRAIRAAPATGGRPFAGAAPNAGLGLDPADPIIAAGVSIPPLPAAVATTLL